MKPNTELKIKQLKNKLTPILENYPIKRLGLFGSYTRGEEMPDSDIDLLVEYDDGVEFGLLDISMLRLVLMDELGKEVDLVEYDSVKPHYKEYIIPNEVRIYEKGK